MFQLFNLAEFRREMSDYLPVGVCILDRQLTIHHWNRRLVEWTGLKSHEMFGQNLIDSCPRFGHVSFQKRIEDGFQSGCPITFSASIHKFVIEAHSAYGPEGVMYQDAMMLPLHDHPNHALLVITDVTRRVLESNALRTERHKLKQLAESLQKQAIDLRIAQDAAIAANRAKSDFLANVSHEIRTPMTAIIGFADVLNDFEVTQEERQNSIDTIRSNGEHLLQLINDILDVSKIEAGRLEMDITTCSLPELIDALSKIFAPRAEKRGIGFEIKVAPFTPTVFDSDPLRLKQVLINLLTNAVKFTEVGSVQLHISLAANSSNSPQLQFEIVDTGVGMSPEQLAQLFQPFVQVDSSAARRFTGTGLGLVISKRICDLLGGQIEVTSQPNVGTRFLVRLPVDPARLSSAPVRKATAQTAASTGTEKAERPLSHLRVLLAEDGLDNQKLIGFRLAKDGADFTVVGDGRSAVTLVNQAKDLGRPFDIVLMDMQMPVMDGYEATTTLRQQGFALPVIALTAHAMASDQQVCLDAGCSGYHTKPINWSELRQLILSQVSAARSTTEPQLAAPVEALA